MFPIYYFTGLASLFLASIAAYFSITGLGALYASAFVPIVIMGSGIEFGKIIATFWLHQNFKTAPIIWVFLLIVTVIGSMAITSGGVYGYLARSHLEQETPLTQKALQIERIDNRIQSEQDSIKRAQSRIDQLDGIVDTLIEFDKISGPTGSVAVRNSQQLERDQMQAAIDQAFENIDQLNDKKLTLQQSVASSEAKLGPVKYLAALLGLPTDQSVRYFTLLVVILLDPFAIMLVVATSISYTKHQSTKNTKQEQVREIIKEIEVPVEKIVEVPVEKVVERIVEVEKEFNFDHLTEFLEAQEVQQALVNDPKLLASVEQLIGRAQTKTTEPSKQNTDTGWYNRKNPLKNEE